MTKTLSQGLFWESVFWVCIYNKKSGLALFINRVSLLKTLILKNLQKSCNVLAFDVGHKNDTVKFVISYEN